MPHQNTTSSTATSQNAANEPDAPNDQGRDQNASARPEPKSYTAAGQADASLAPPAAGEVSDYADDGDALGGEVQQGATHANRPDRTEARTGQGPKTREGNAHILKDGSAD